VIFWKNWRD